MRRRFAALVGLVLAGCGGAEEGPEARGLSAATRGHPARGARAILGYGCGACHVIPGVREARGMVGPPLSDFARRAYVAGRVPNTPDNLIAWIRRPDSLEPGTVMPSLGVSEQDARDIAAYLYLRTGTAAGPPRLFPASLLEGD